MGTLLILASFAGALALLLHRWRRTTDMSRSYYRTKDGKADYYFSFEQEADGEWRAYILSQPGYGPRDTGAHPTHRLRSGGRYYVCWDHPLRSEREARQVAALWADKTQEYIRTGSRF